jgi:hypothetical protein
MHGVHSLHGVLSPSTQDIRRDFRNQEASLESVNAQGTGLIEGCQDDLSGASGRLKLSNLNDLWGDTLSVVADREEKLKEGLVMADNYQVSGSPSELLTIANSSSLSVGSISWSGSCCFIFFSVSS